VAQRKPVDAQPAAEAKRALAQWRLALRYAAAAARPGAEAAARVVRATGADLASRAVERLRALGEERADQGQAAESPDEGAAEDEREPDGPAAEEDGAPPADEEPGAEADGTDEEPDADERDGGADPLRAGFEHAYSDEVENYEHRDAYANTR
jgi:hypothetical protein